MAIAQRNDKALPIRMVRFDILKSEILMITIPLKETRIENIIRVSTIFL